MLARLGQSFLCGSSVSKTFFRQVRALAAPSKPASGLVGKTVFFSYRYLDPKHRWEIKHVSLTDKAGLVKRPSHNSRSSFYLSVPDNADVPVNPKDRPRKFSSSHPSPVGPPGVTAAFFCLNMAKSISDGSNHTMWRWFWGTGKEPREDDFYCNSFPDRMVVGPSSAAVVFKGPKDGFYPTSREQEHRGAGQGVLTRPERW
ncbi:hypothetical protein JCM6882_009351 [Rhodosporidiobolus microsporus]